MNHGLYAVVDIGSNSLRLLKGRLDDNGQWCFSQKEIVTTRLGRDIDNTRRLWPEGIEASYAAMEQWKKNLGGYHVCAVATSAVREAEDGQAFLAEIRSRFGWCCRAITGLEEGAYSFRGASYLATKGKVAAVLDVGGGSSEMSIGKDGEASWSHSYAMGAVRFTKPGMTADEYKALNTYCLSQWLPLPAKPEVLIGVGGTMTSLAAMDLALDPYDPEQVEGTVITAEKLSTWIDRLMAMTGDERRAVVGLQPKRADIIVAGLIIVQSCLAFYHIPSVCVSEKDLLEGVFMKHSFHDAAWCCYVP